MTPSKYIICRIALAFGYTRKNARMGDAASETHLLKESEAFLGQMLWKDIENIEALSMEYWNLRKLSKEHERIANILLESEATLTKAYEERAGLIGESNESYLDLLQERQTLVSNLEQLARRRDQVVGEAVEIRKTYDGIKMKREVLKKDSDQVEQLRQVEERMADLKRRFTHLKEERLVIGDNISTQEVRIREIEQQIQIRKQERAKKAHVAYQHIGEANQAITKLRAEVGVLETQMRQLYTQIGKYVSRNAFTNPECMKACKNHKGFIEVVSALRKSIQYNHKLAQLC